MKKLTALAFFLFVTCPLQAQINFYLYKHGDKFTLNPWLRYNSVEGAFTGVSGQYFFTDDFKLRTDAGYAIAGKFVRYQTKLDKSFAIENNEWVISAMYQRATATSDESIIPDWQNSLSSLLFRRDFYQHYELHGLEVETGHIWEGTFSLRLFGGLRDFSSMDNKARFGLLGFAGDNLAAEESFSINAPVVDGRDVYAGIRLTLDTRPSPVAPISAWIASATYTNASLLHGRLDSDLDYQRLSLSLTRQWTPFRSHRMKTTLVAGSYEGERFSPDSMAMAEQFLFDGGGYGTLRGYRYREFSNHNRMLLFKWDYSFNGTFLPKTPLKKIWGIGWIFSAFDLALFADAGYYWTTADHAALFRASGFSTDALRADAGLGLTAKDWVRFEFAFPLRKGITTRRGDWTFYFNLRGNL